jgi:hypothetical protein
MSCTNLKISEMDKARHLYPEDIFPLVQEGKNKIITLD